MSKTGPKKRGNRRVFNIFIERDSQNKKQKKIKKSKNEATMTKKTLRTLSGSTVYCRNISREMWILCTECELWVHTKCTNGSSKFA